MSTMLARLRTTVIAVCAVVLCGVLVPVSAQATAVTAPVTPPACASEPIDVSWTVAYADGYYRLDTARLEGLSACAGEQLEVTLGSARMGTLAELRVSVPAGALSIPLSEFDIPAVSVDRVSLLLRAAQETPRQPPASEPEYPTSNPDGPTSGGSSGADPTGGGQSATPAPTPNVTTDVNAGSEAVSTSGIGILPRTGAALGWLLALATSLIAVGLWLRRKAAEPQEGSAHV